MASVQRLDILESLTFDSAFHSSPFQSWLFTALQLFSHFVFLLSSCLFYSQIYWLTLQDPWLVDNQLWSELKACQVWGGITMSTSMWATSSPASPLVWSDYVAQINFTHTCKLQQILSSLRTRTGHSSFPYPLGLAKCLAQNTASIIFCWIYLCWSPLPWLLFFPSDSWTLVHLKRPQKYCIWDPTHHHLTYTLLYFILRNIIQGWQGLE